MIPVSKPFLPPEQEYQKYIESIWTNVWLTNNGPLVQELEKELSQYLKVENLLFTSNGTIALQLAIKAFGLNGEIITTPFSYVATTSTISWENCQPVYVDINRATLGIDVNKIEDKITPKTSAILVTHVYGYPSFIEDIEQLAKINNLKLIYDGAHAFGCTYKNKSLLAYGDVSTCSFHATKVFHTIEGGCTIAKDPEIQNRIKLMRNFGHKGLEKFECIGINGKNSEFHAAMGLCNLKYIDEIINRRKKLSVHYTNNLSFKDFQSIPIPDMDRYNFCYYPIVFNDVLILIEKLKILEKHGILARRYFYPVLSQLNYVNQTHMPVAEDIAERVLCLPLYYGLSNNDVNFITSLVN